MEVADLAACVARRRCVAVVLTERHFAGAEPGICIAAHLTDALGRVGLRLRVRLGHGRALARLSAQRAASWPQLAAWDQVPGLPEPISPKGHWRLRKRCGHCAFLSCVPAWPGHAVSDLLLLCQ